MVLQAIDQSGIPDLQKSKAESSPEVPGESTGMTLDEFPRPRSARRSISC